ncbi:response regulator [Marinomonas rhizomae]|uniref:Response regulator receiver domain-containing protein n=1 Tax=Marinomonas rhizomae TaxID=491948 RepID=A0A366JBX0_9GAMM|nr:response regulator [Marinomonas rhizomae]RBP83910.1 response regulator receiver domain-containing protein [Marinomonas rhizomae]RNF73386.1 response regulator [Marinomonas rhizomae]
MPLKILLVDDSKVSRLALSKSLKKIDDSLIIFEANGADAAEELLKTESVDQMLVDYNMPDRNGYDLVKVVSVSYPSIKLTLVTANIQDTIKDKVQSLGVGFIAKPAKIEELAEIMGS